MDLMKEFQKFIEDNTKKVSEMFSNFSANNPVGDWFNTYYKDFFAQTKDMVTGFFQQDVYNKLMKEMETYKNEIMDKFSGLTKNVDEFKKIQKQFEDFMTTNSKKFLEVANSTFKDSYDKLNKNIMENLGKLDFAKFFKAGQVAEKKTTTAAGGKKA